MTREYLHAPITALAEGGDAVIGPAEDGGYALIGLSRLVPELFDGVDWGGPGVMRVTRSRIERLGWRYSELPVLWDVDRPEDLSRPGIPQVDVPHVSVSWAPSAGTAAPRY